MDVRLEASGYGGFDSINKINKQDTQLGNAYYQDKASNMNVTFNFTYNGNILGYDDFESENRRMWNEFMKEWQARPVKI